MSGSGLLNIVDGRLINAMEMLPPAACTATTVSSYTDTSTIECAVPLSKTRVKLGLVVVTRYIHRRRPPSRSTTRIMRIIPTVGE
jgi:hypothetical protein